MGTRATETVCGSRFFRATLTLALLLAFGFGLPAVIDARAGHGVTASRTLTFRLDHFQCYRVDPGTAFKRRTVGLVDQFGKSKAVVSQLATLCAPVRKNRSVWGA